MSWALRSRPAAKDDLQHYAADIATDDVDAALRFIDTVELALARLAEHPRMGTAVRLEHPELQGLRRLVLPAPFRNYLVFYRAFATEESVEVIRIIHATRDLPRQLLEHDDEDDDI